MNTEVLENVQALLAEKTRESEAEISLIDLAKILLQRKRLIAGVTIGAAAITAVVVSFLPPTFKAEASILPPQQQQSSLSALAAGALGGMAGSGMASSLGLKNPGDLYVGILGSRTIFDDIIQRFHLQQVYQLKLSSETRKKLKGNASFTSGKDSLITIAVEDHDPKRAADMANAFVDELYKQNSRLALTDSSQRRLFFEQELAKEKDALAAAEIALRNTQQSTGLLAPTGQAETLIRAGAQLRAEIVSREVQLQAMRSYATDENPQIEVLKKEVTALQSQLGQLKAKNGSGSAFDISAGKLPESGLEYIRRVRDVKYHETLFELLAKQYEAARIDEAKQAPVIQVVDHAITPDRKSGPQKTLFTLAAALISLTLCSVLVLLRQMSGSSLLQSA